MKVVIKDPTYAREDKYTQRIIRMSIEKLKARYEQYHNQNKTVDDIYGDNVLIHDKINGFCVFKTHINRIQMRLLYTVRNDKIIIVSHFIKKDHPHDWIPYFENVTKNL